MNRYRGIGLPVLLVAAGLVALLANLGAIEWSQLLRLFDLWPLLLIVLGVELILRRAASPPVATGLGAAVAIVAVVAAIAYVAAGPVAQFGEHTGTASAPLSSAETGRLTVSGGGVQFNARLGDVGDDLYRATYRNPSGQDPTFDNGSGTVGVHYEGSRQIFGSVGPRTLDMTLSSSVAWTLTLSGGGFSANIDLHDGQLKAISLEGGGINLTAHLPQPRGTVPISVSGGGINAVLHRPAGVEARVTVSGGGSAIDADGTHRSALAGDATWTSSGYDSAVDRYDVRVSGGGTHVSVDTLG